MCTETCSPTWISRQLFKTGNVNTCVSRYGGRGRLIEHYSHIRSLTNAYLVSEERQYMPLSYAVFRVEIGLRGPELHVLEHAKVSKTAESS